MTQLSLNRAADLDVASALWKMLAASFALLLLAIVAHGQAVVGQDEKAPLVIENVEDGDVFGAGRSVVVRGVVKHGAISFGGDVIVEGSVEGDVAAIGGSVIQRAGSHIGGDVIVIGGAYHHDKSAPDRKPESTTVMYAGYEQELRELARNPTSFLAPHWSITYLGQRVLAVLFWFIISLALTAVTPGAVGRAVARLQLNRVRVGAIGFLSAVLIAFGVPACLSLLPTAIGAVVGMLALLLMMMAYLFGRVVINAATGRWLQRKLLPEGKHSESLALLLGALLWAIILSLPYIWPTIVAGLLVTSLGLALTARYRAGWKRAHSA